MLSVAMGSVRSASKRAAPKTAVMATRAHAATSSVSPPRRTARTAQKTVRPAAVTTAEMATVDQRKTARTAQTTVGSRPCLTAAASVLKIAFVATPSAQATRAALGVPTIAAPALTFVATTRAQATKPASAVISTAVYASPQDVETSNAHPMRTATTAQKIAAFVTP